MMTENEPGPSEVEPKKHKVHSPICYDEVYNLCDLALELSTEEKAIEFCKAWGLLPKSRLCHNCGNVLTKYYSQPQRSVIKPFRYSFMCCKAQCSRRGGNKLAVTKSTFFERMKISYRKALLLIYLFCRKSSIENAVWETSGRSFNNQTTSCETVVDIFSLCRQVCAGSFCKRDGMYKKVGGLGCTVEIDGAKFGKSQAIIDGKKVELEGRWAMGGICRETSDCFFVPVEDRTEDNLIGIIVERVKRGTTIVTDCFTSSKLEEKGYKHLRVGGNHIDGDGEGLPLIESTWYAIKQAIPKSVSNHKHFDLGGHLAEYIWRKQHKDEEHHFVRLLEDIAKAFPGPHA